MGHVHQVPIMASTAALALNHTNMQTIHEREHADALQNVQCTLLEHLRKQPLSEQLLWVYWHPDTDVSWLGNWVLIQAIPHPTTGLKNATVHEVLAPCSPAQASARQGGAHTEGVNLSNVARVAKSFLKQVREYCALTRNNLQ